MSHSARIEEELLALNRGDLDVENLINRLHRVLSDSSDTADDLLTQLEQAHDNSVITEQDFTRLRNFVVDTRSSLESANNDNDSELTRLATEASFDTRSEKGEPLTLGTRLRDRFILDEVVGVGGMGTVYRGRDVLKLEAQDRNPFVAIKVLNDKFKVRPEAFIALQREASRQQRLAHPNIATVHDFDRSGEVIFITMEYLDGRTLDEVIKQEIKPAGGLPLAKATTIIDQLCAALTYAHEHKIVHADFKPGNCIVTAQNQVKVLDFGIARAVKDPDGQGGDETLFDPRSIGALTPTYASPEMLENSAAPDQRDDIYALGCVTYELLTGIHPFLRVPADRAKEQDMQAKRIGQLSRRQNDTLLRSLAFERNDRTPTVAEFHQDLLQDEPMVGNWKWLGAGLAAILVLVGLAMLPGYFDRVAAEEVLALLHSDTAVDVVSGIERLDDLPEGQRSRLLLDGRSAIIRHFEQQLETGLAKPDMEVPYTSLGDLLSQAVDFYPDSATLSRLTTQFNQQRALHLSALSTAFDGLLKPQRLLSDPDEMDLQDLLQRLLDIDPVNPLLDDTRIPGAYANAVERSIAAENYTLAQAYLDTGRQISPSDPTLTDLNDTLAALLAEQARLAQVAEHESQLARLVESSQSLTAATALAEAVAALLTLDPDNASATSTGATYAKQVAVEIDTLLASERLANLEEFLETQGPSFIRLGLNDVVAAVTKQHEALTDQIQQTSQALRTMLAAERFDAADSNVFEESIQLLRTIDSNSPLISEFQQALTQSQITRAHAFAQQEQWSQAQQQLQLAASVELTPELNDTLQKEHSTIVALEKQVLAQRIEATRLQKQAATQAQQQRDRELAEAERQAQAQRQVAAAKAEEQRQLDAQRLQAEQQAQHRAAIATAARAVTAATSEFVPEPSAIDKTLEAINALAQLDPNHAELTVARESLPQQVATATTTLIQRGKLDDAERLMAHASNKISPAPDLTEPTQQLSTARKAARIAQRNQDIQRTEQRLQAQLGNRPTLFTASAGREAIQTLSTLAGLAGKDSQSYATAEARFLDLHVREARSLIEQKRFSKASQILQRAAGVANSSVVQTAQNQLTDAQAEYRAERAEQEQASRIDALQQRTAHQINSNQLAEATDTLKALKRIAPANNYANEQAPRLLANAYVERAARLLSQGKLEASDGALRNARSWDSRNSKIAALAQSLSVERLAEQVSRWFDGTAESSSAVLRSNIQKIQAHIEARYAELEQQWTTLASTRLGQLREQRERHNAYLGRAQNLLPAVTSLQAIALLTEPEPEPVIESTPPISALAASDLLGKWCGEGVDILFEDKKLVFILGRQQVDYRLTSYQVVGDRIAVHWTDKRQGPMVNEFGNFDTQHREMVQLRGRKESDSRWQDYNRSFKRCT